MASVNDATNVQSAVERERERLAEADIPEADREAIQNFIQHRRVHGTKSGTYAESSERSDLTTLRLASTRASMPLVEMGMDDVNGLLATLTAPKDDGGYGIGRGIDSYTRVLRVLYRWLDDHNQYGDFGWWEQIKTGNIDYPEPSDRRFPRQPEIDAMARAAGQRGTLRDVALLSFFSDAATRRTLGAQLRIGDLDLVGEKLANAPAAFRPNPEGKSHKGVEQKWYPLFDCLADLRVWVNRHHPDPENDDAPLWTAPNYRDRRDRSFCHHCSTAVDGKAETCPDCGETVYDDGAISARQINSIFKKFGETAGLDLDSIEIKPHAFRHAAVGRWKERGYSLSQVQRRVAWSDRAAADMWGKYGDPDDDALDSGIADLEGAETAADGRDETSGDPAPERWTCGNCNSADITSPHCPQCGQSRDGVRGQEITINEENPLVLGVDDEGNMTVRVPSLGIEAPVVMAEDAADD